MRRGIKLSVLALIGLSNVASATDWGHILGQIQDSQTGEIGVLYDNPNEERRGILYNAFIDYEFSDGNNDKHFSASEHVRLTLTSQSGEKLTTGEYLSKEELTNWARKHSDQFLKSIFGTDPSATVSGTTSSVAVASNEIIQLSTTSRQRKKVNKTKNGKKDKGFNSGFSSLVIMDSEKASMHSNGIKGSSSAFKFSYDTELESGNDLGALFSYRKTKASDVYGSKSTAISFSPYYKYYKTISDKIEVIGVGNLLVNKRDLDSSLFKNKNFSYLEYGAGVSAIPSYYVNDKLSFSLPIGVQTLKKKIPSNDGSSIDFIIDAINDLGFQTSVNYGLGAEYAIKPNWYTNLNVIRTQEVGSDKSNIDKATYYNLGMTYYSELFNYRLGYKTVRNVSNYDEDAYMVSLQYNW